MNKESNELFNEYQKGYIHCLCNVVSKGCKRISDDLDDLLFEVQASEDELRQAIDEIASQYGVKLYTLPYTEEFHLKGDASVYEIKQDGTEQKVAGPGKFSFETFSLVLYKNEEDLARFLELCGVKNLNEDFHKELGRLYGYGEEEIAAFLRKQKSDDNLKIRESL